MIDIDIFYWYGREEDGVFVFGIDFIYLLELFGGELCVFCCWYYIG